MSQPKTPDQKPKGLLAIQILAMPKDTNANGDIFGGWLVSHMDMAGAFAARMRAQCTVVTVAIDSMVFIKPVYVGEVICCYADLVRVGHTSVKFKVEVWTLAPNDGMKKVAEGDFTFVALDEHGKPQAVDRK